MDSKQTINIDSKQNPWYLEKISDEVSDEARRLLRDYGCVPADEVDDHIYKIRDMAWAVAPFPCIGKFHFLSLNLSRHPQYAAVVRFLKSQGAKFLDIGCCVGQDIRKLIADGAPSENLYGSDLFKGYFEVGYELFRDKQTCRSEFFAADIFDESSPLQNLTGQMNVIHTGLFFHLFDWEKQLVVAKRIISLLRPEPGSLLLGEQVGSLVPGERALPKKKAAEANRVTYLHDPASFERWWREVEAITGTKWKVTIRAVIPRKKPAAQNKNTDNKREGNDNFFGEETTWLQFSLERL